jgi:clan AA aspartic protease
VKISPISVISVLFLEDTMGIVYTTIKVRNPLKDQESIEVTAKVDTGATLLVISDQIAKEFTFPVIRTQTVKYANAETADRDVVWGVELEICGRKGIFEAIVEPNKQYPLIGAVVMETLDLIIEPRSFKVYPNPRSQLPMVEIE